MDFSNYKFIYGKSYDECNVYHFISDDEKGLTVSEKIGNFINGNTSQYLLFEYENEYKKNVYQYIDKKSYEYQNMTNIRPIIDNLNGVTAQCTNCKSIVLKEQLTSGKGDKCIYCDKYLCKKCKKFFPLVQLDKNRLCEKCRKDKEDDHD